MSYVSSSIARIVDRINRTYFLPAIQRPYVWEPEKVISLFDSILKGYPISSFLFWEIDPEHRSHWEIYKFAEAHREGEPSNILAEPNGQDVVLVLDGQQRLTSLLIGLRGTFSTRTKHGRRNNPNAWTANRLYLNLLKDAEAQADGGSEDNGVTYGLRFAPAQPADTSDALWIRVGDILRCTSDRVFYELQREVIARLPGSATLNQKQVAETNLSQLYTSIWKNEVIAFYTEKDQDYDRVLDIFVRANDGGTKLSKSDLLLSTITSKWGAVSARQEIYAFVDHLNKNLFARNDFDKDFIMKSCLVLTDLDPAYKVHNFTAGNLRLIEQSWPKIKHTLQSAVELVNRFGIAAENLTSVNALMPIAYYIHKLGGKPLDGSSTFEASNARNIQRWLLASLLNGVFSGSSDNTIRNARSILNTALKRSSDFPIQDLTVGLATRGRTAGFTNSSVDDLIGLRYNQRNCFLALSLLYDVQDWGAGRYHIDHIIPRSLCSRAALMRGNISESRIERITGSVDQLGNLQILLARENLEKNDMSFSQWIQSRDRDFLKLHLIPDNPDLWEPAALPEFVRAREVLIRARITELYSPVQDGALEEDQTLGN